MEDKQIFISKFKDIQPLAKYARKEHVIINYFKGSIWLAAKKNNRLVGCVCCQKKKDKARFKGDFVLPEYRNEGIYRSLFEARNWLIRGLHLKEISAFCTQMSIILYLENGFQVISKKVLKDKTKIYYVKREK